MPADAVTTSAPAPPRAPTRPATRRTLRSLLVGLIVATRPKQWLKSVLVPAAPAAAGMLGNVTVLWQTAVAVVTFTACAAGGYLVNDAADVEQDRRHPKERYRPIAAGIVPVQLARRQLMVRELASSELPMSPLHDVKTATAATAM